MQLQLSFKHQQTIRLVLKRIYIDFAGVVVEVVEGASANYNTEYGSFDIVYKLNNVKSPGR